jgi:ABC-type transporter Mla subunit MlaD
VSELVAPVGLDRPELGEWYKSLKIVGPIDQTVTSVQDGNWAGALFGLAGGVTDLADAVLDPIATLVSSVAGFLLDYMPPLPEFLDSLAGDPAEVTAIADTWSNISGHLTTVAADFDAAVDAALAPWVGLTADTYREVANVTSGTISSMAGVATGLSAGFAIASGIVAAVRAIVRDLIADLVGKLISWVVECLATVGIGLAWIGAQASAAIAKWSTRAADWIQKVTEAIENFAALVQKLDGALTELAPSLKKLEGILNMPGGPQFGDAIPGLAGLGNAGYQGATS